MYPCCRLWTTAINRGRSPLLDRSETDFEQMRNRDLKISVLPVGNPLPLPSFLPVEPSNLPLQGWCLVSSPHPPLTPPSQLQPNSRANLWPGPLYFIENRSIKFSRSSLSLKILRRSIPLIKTWCNRPGVSNHATLGITELCLRNPSISRNF